MVVMLLVTPFVLFASTNLIHNANVEENPNWNNDRTKSPQKVNALAHCHLVASACPYSHINNNS